MNYTAWILISSMGRLKHRLLFYGLSFSAYLSPIVMIISILTNYWLFSVERITGHGQSDTITTSTLKSTTNLPSNLMINSTKPISLPTSRFIIQSNSTTHITLTTKTFESLGYIEASYGLWKICKITGKWHVKNVFFIFKLLKKIFFQKMFLCKNIVNTLNTFKFPILILDSQI